MNIDSVKLNDLLKRVYIRFASIGISNIYEILTIDDDQELGIDGFDVIDEVLKTTIDRVEYLEPFVLRTKLFFRQNQSIVFTDNFEEVLAGTVSRDYLMLVPRVIQSINNTYLGSLSGLHYEPPVLYNNRYDGTHIVNLICTRPLVRKRLGNKYTDDSKLYFMGESYLPALCRFLDLLTVNLGKYLIRLDENTRYPSMPIDVMQGLQTYISDLESKNTNDYEISHGYYPIYGFEQ